MANVTEVVVPDIGGAEDVDIIEVSVKPGDTVSVDDPLITLESDKASMEIPSPYDGVIKELKIAVGDKVSEGALILTLETSGETASKSAVETKPETATQERNTTTTTSIKNVVVPDIGGAEDVDIIEVSVKSGDALSVNDPLITLESDKASMEIPSPYDGVIKEVKIKVGDKVSEGALILTMEAQDKATTSASEQSAPTNSATKTSIKNTPSAQTPTQYVQYSDDVHAGPSTRRLAREYGVPLDDVAGTGQKGRIQQSDVKNYVRSNLGKAGGLEIPPAPKVDHAKFGEIEILPLNKIKKLTGVAMTRNWLTIPHVTQFADADITEMEAFRQEQKSVAAKRGVKLTPLVFIMKAVVESLKAFPHFNASLSDEGESLIVKKHYHIGIAVDTPNGLVVPVIRDVDQKDIFQLAEELTQISQKARDTGLTPAEMSGSTFTISSLGGIGGTAFTPIVKAPDVAILGVSKAQKQPVFVENEFVARLMLPLSLSYDHRVIDGADGARFTVDLANRLTQIREILS